LPPDPDPKPGFPIRIRIHKVTESGSVSTTLITGDYLLSRLHAARLLLAASWDGSQTPALASFLASLPPLQQAKILRSVLSSDSLLASHFRPLSPDCPALVPRLMAAAKAVGLRSDRIAERLHADLLAAAVKTEGEGDDASVVQRKLLLEVTVTGQLAAEQLRQLIDLLIGQPLYQLVRGPGGQLTRQGLLLCGALTALSNVNATKEAAAGIPAAAERFSGAVEHLLAQVDPADSLPSTALTSYLVRWPAAAEKLSENLFYVCCGKLASQPFRGNLNNRGF
jgi:hypothetical protein